jgi:hypothetical protein
MGYCAKRGVMLGIIYTSVYKMSECGKQLPNKAICDGQVANPSVPRMDIAESISYRVIFKVVRCVLRNLCA